MNREIKFRAWDKEHNQMVENVGIQTGKNENSITISSEGIFVGNKCLSMILMQYTGLKDKNGKEIYEGDVVKGINRIHEFESTMNVHYLNGCFMFGNWNAHEYFNRHQSIEIIGNLWQYPELLEVSP